MSHPHTFVLGGIFCCVNRAERCRYDLTRLAQPYLKELLDVKDGSFALSVAKTFVKKVNSLYLYPTRLISCRSRRHSRFPVYLRFLGSTCR